jgi:tetratricopeptide (TPR) repeat protein
LKPAASAPAIALPDKTILLGDSALLDVSELQRRSILDIKPYASAPHDLSVEPTSAGGVANRAEAARALVELCEARLAETKDAIRKARLHYESARLLEYPLGDTDAALAHYRSALALAADHEPTVAGLRRLLLRRGAFAEALPLFDAQIRLTAAPEEKAALLYEKGRCLEDRLEKRAEARAAYEAALELAPGDAALLRAVARCQRRAHAWVELDQTLEKLAQSAASDARLRAAHVAERARLTEVHKADAPLATELFQQAFATAPDASSSLRDLQRLHETQRRYRDLVGALEAQVTASSDATVRATTLYRIARVQADRLGELKAAVHALERATRLSPQDRTILEELARTYQRLGAYAELAGVYERLVAIGADRWSQIDWMMRIAELAEQRLGDEARAISWYERALGVEPTHIPALQALAKLYVRAELWPPLIALHLREANHAIEPLRRAAALQRVAEIYEQKLDDRSQAIAHHARALGIVPGYDSSFRALTRLYSEGHRWNELVELYERAVELAQDPETQFTFLFKIGRIWEDALNAPLHALHAYRRILQSDDKHFGALHALQRAAERSSEWNALVEGLVHEARLLDDPKRKVALLHRAGEVSEELLHDDDRALAHYRQVLELEPRYAPALSSLGRIHYRAGRWEDLLEVYRKELAISGPAEQRAAVLHRMGRICEEQLGHDEEALNHYRRAVEAHGGHAAALHDYERLLAGAGRHKELVQVLEGELARADSESTRARTALRIAEVYESHLDQADKALEAYGAALAAVPGLQPARDGRARLLARTAQYAALATELEAEAETSSDPTMRLTARLRAGDVCRDDLKDPARAARNYEAALAEAPGHVGALVALEALYADLGRTDDLKRILSTQASTFVDVSAQVGALRELVRFEELAGQSPWAECHAILVRAPLDRRALEIAERAALAGQQPEALEPSHALAEVDAQLGAAGQSALAAAHDTRLGEYFEAQNPVRALERYRVALERDPENLAAARGVSRVAEAVGDPLLLEEAARGEARVTRDVQRAGRLLERAAELRRARGDVQGAAEALERALEIHPDRLSAAGALVALLTGDADIDRLIHTLSSAAQRASDPDRGARHWIAVAGLYAERKGDVPAALAALGRVEKQLPDHVPMLLELAELYCRDAQWAQAAARLERVLATRPEDAITVAASLRLAELLHERLERHDGARQALATVLSKHPEHPEALRRLLALQLGTDDPEAVETARRVAQASPDPVVRAGAFATQGQLLAKRKDTDGAVAAYAEAVRIVGLAGAAARELKELLIQQKVSGQQPAWTAYAGALAQFTASGPTEPEAFAAAALELARVQADELGQIDAAIATLDQGLRATPTSPVLRVELATRLRKGGQLERALDELRRLLEADSLRLETWRDLHEVFDRLGRNAEAHLSIGPLLLLDGATDLQRATWASRAPRTGYLGEGAMGESVLAEIDVLGRHRATCGLLGQLAEGLSKVYAPGLERFGLSARDRIHPKSGHALRATADRVARIFGVDDFDLYAATEYDGPVAVVFTDPVGIVLPASFASRSEVEQVFLLARPLCNVARGLSAVDALPDGDLGLLLAAAGRLVDGSFGSGRYDEASLEPLARRVAKSTSWLSRGRLEDAARAYLGSGAVDAADFGLRARLSAARAALLVADDVVSCVQILRRTEGDLSGAKPPRSEVAVRTLRDMLFFWVSDPAMQARRDVGML